MRLIETDRITGETIEYVGFGKRVKLFRFLAEYRRERVFQIMGRLSGGQKVIAGRFSYHYESEPATTNQSKVNASTN